MYLLHLLPYFIMPSTIARDLRANPVDPFAPTQPRLSLSESNIIPETVRRSGVRSSTPSEGGYVIDRPPRNTGHGG